MTYVDLWLCWISFVQISKVFLYYYKREPVKHYVGVHLYFSAGHSRSGGVQRHEGTVHEEGGWLSACLLRHRSPELWEHGQLPHPDPQGQRQVSTLSSSSSFEMKLSSSFSFSYSLSLTVLQVQSSEILLLLMFITFTMIHSVLTRL